MLIVDIEEFVTLLFVYNYLRSEEIFDISIGWRGNNNLTTSGGISLWSQSLYQCLSNGKGLGTAEHSTNV